GERSSGQDSIATAAARIPERAGLYSRAGGGHGRESPAVADGVGPGAPGRRLPVPRGPRGRGTAVVAARAPRRRSEGRNEPEADARSAAGGRGAAGAGEGGPASPRMEQGGGEALPRRAREAGPAGLPGARSPEHHLSHRLLAHDDGAAPGPVHEQRRRG